MRKILNDLKWILVGLGTAFSCMYTTYIMPGEKFKGIKEILF